MPSAIFSIFANGEMSDHRLKAEKVLPDMPTALARERQIKSYKGGRAFKALLKSS